MRNKRKSSLLVLFAIIILVAMYMNSSYLILKATTVEDDKLLFKKIVKKNTEFTLRYQHSIAKTLVDEVYRIVDANKIEYVAFIYSSLESGLPLGDEFEFVMGEGIMTVSGVDLSFTEIDNVRIATNHPHYLICDDLEYNLTEAAKGKTLRIRVKKFHLY